MANLPAKDGSGTLIYIKADGTGTNDANAYRVTNRLENTSGTQINPATEGTLAEIEANTDGLEGLLTTIDADTSAIVGHVDGIETLLTAVSNSVDGLEGFTDGIETALSSRALESGGNLAGIRTDLGTDGSTPPTLPGGSTGVRGWLRYLASLLPSLASGRWPVDGSGVTQPVSGTVTANLGTIGTAATAANQSTMIGHVDGIEGLLTTISGNVDGLEGFTDGVEASLSSIDAKASALALETTQLAQSALYGAVTEAAPSTDTASSGLNGRLQRIAQRLTSLIALIPSNLTVTSTRLLVDGSGVTQPVSGTVAATQSGNWSMRLQDGSGTALTSVTRGAQQALSVQLVDGAGGQITNFGSSPAGITTIITPTLDTAAYAVGDVLFVQNTLANSVIASGGQGTIESVTVVDSDDVPPVFTLVFFRDTITIATVNSAWNVSDADMAKAIGFVPFNSFDYKDFGANRIATRQVYFRFSPASGTSIFCAAFVDGAATLTASGLTISVGIGRES